MCVVPSSRRFIGTLGVLGRGLIDLGVPGEAVSQLFARIKTSYGCLRLSAKFQVWFRDGKITRYVLLSLGQMRGKATDAIEEGPEEKTPRVPNWDLCQEFANLPMAVVRQFRFYADALGKEDALDVCQQQMEQLSASFDCRHGIKFSGYAFQAMVKALSREYHRRNHAGISGELPQNYRSVYGCGCRDRFGNPAINAEMNERLDRCDWQKAATMFGPSESFAVVREAI